MITGGLAGCAYNYVPPVEDSMLPVVPPKLPKPDAATLLPLSIPSSQEAARKKEAIPITGPIELGIVLQSVSNHFPLLLSISEERAIAAGQRLSAEGGFDTNVKARALGQDGTYENSRYEFSAEQLTPFNGLSYFGGYRLSTGEFPPYNGSSKTGDGGEFRGGMVLPLLRNGPIDRQRAAVRQAQIAESLADPLIQRARLDFFRTASRLYWNWLAAGEQYFVTQELLKLAQDRQAGFETQLQRGAIAEIIVIDNRRLIAERQGTVVSAQRRLQQAAIELSLYLRDDTGQPQLPTLEQLPRILLTPRMDSPKSEAFDKDMETAYINRPELRRFILLKQRVSVDLQLAANQLLPAFNTGVVGHVDVGAMKKNSDGTPGDRQAIEGNVSFDMPLQFRDAGGRQAQARALLMQLQFQEQFAREQIGAEVQDTVSQMDRAADRIQRAREEVQIAQQVTELEMTRFRVGQVTRLEVNLRELAAAGARAKLIDAVADFYRAQADFRAALGIGN